MVALLNECDQHHAICVETAQTLTGPFYSCWPPVTEALYLLRTDPMAVHGLCSRIQSQRIALLELQAKDVAGIAAILARYADQHFDFADASLMYLAEREGLDTVFTIDHRHFSVFRTSSGAALKLLPLSLGRGAARL